MSGGRRLYQWLNHRLGISTAILPVIEHPVPRGVDWWYVFGSATLAAFIFQVITGVALAMSYVPAPNSAYQSLNFITNTAVLGSLIRGIHYFGASAMVILIAIHLAHEFLTGSYKFPRELNWFTGVLLFFLTLGMAFTGQLLRWDQNAYWAVVVAAEQVGRTPFIGEQMAELVVAGQTVGGATLTRFYATHVFLLPALMFLLIGIHLYLVIFLGISEPPKVGEPVDPATYDRHYHQVLEEDGIPFFPDAVWKDVVFALAVGAVVVVLAAIVGPPQLGTLADPTIVQADPRPDWYFIWYFALFALIPPSIENVFILGFPLVVAVVLLVLPFVANKGERSPWRRPWAVGIVVVAALTIAILVREGNIAPWSPNFSPGPIPATVTAQMSPSAGEGAIVFENDGCHNCHQVAGTGGLRGPDLTHVGSRLTRPQLITRVLAGGNGMPAYAGIIPPDRLNNLVDFLTSLK
ncbi:MAG TPA: cytochrome b N-terminal domain-containing protein [Chloroflexota bacterium]|nr:cytochrome b N-terminal domain-containing protein [Chloroflexota bacterium]